MVLGFISGLYCQHCSSFYTSLSPRSLSLHLSTYRRFRFRQKRPRRASLIQCTSHDPPPSEDSLEDKSKVQVAKRIERTFVQACVPGTKPYVEALGEFVRSALEAYSHGYNLTALQFELQASKDEESLNLKQDEVELRAVWLTLVYKTLREIAFPVKSRIPSREVSYDRLDDFVKNIVSAVRQGYDMKRIQLEQALVGHNDQPRSPIESAILNQSLRLVLLTLSVANALGGQGPAPKMPESL